MVVLKDTFIFPYENTSLLIGREFSSNAVHNAVENNGLIIVTKQTDTTVDLVTAEDIHTEATICEIREISKIDTSTFKVNFHGKYRVKITKIEALNKIFIGNCILYFEEYSEIEFRTYHKTFFTKLNTLRQKVGTSDIPLEMIDTLIDTEDQMFFGFTACSLLAFGVEKRLMIMRSNLSEILEFIILDLQEKIYYVNFEESIDAKVKKNIGSKNKQFWIKEKIEALKKEMNDNDSYHDDFMKSKEDKNLWPSHVHEIFKREYSKYLRYSNSTEGQMILQHLQWICDVPWYTTKQRKIDIKSIMAFLDEYHVGSKELKEKLIMSINLRNQEESGFVILLIGPPGVGKTTIAKQFAEAIEAPWYEIQVGGMSDSSVLCGHHRTYVGSMPGNIAWALKQTGVINPVIILDEIDKICKNYKNPEDALLRILDINHNNLFKDNYLDPTIDLSKVTWILTANNESAVSPTLLDRCVKIYVNGYCIAEKIEIAHKTISKLYKKLKIKDHEINFDETAIIYLIENYTTESGVRRLAQLLEMIIKKAIIELQDKSIEHIVINKTKINKYLELENKNSLSMINIKPGTVRGLAYTSQGGALCYVQCTAFPIGEKNKEFQVITGNVKDVMKESVLVAISYIKSNAKDLGIDVGFFDRHTIHVHFPEGAVPKDGPSAGITIGVAIISLIKNKAVRVNIAMTGEITLNGEISAIGGLNEKLNAAERTARLLGSKELFEVFVPKDNMDYIANRVHETVRNSLIINPIENFPELIEQVF
jgi:ATP-dependent Lon protease